MFSYENYLPFVAFNESSLFFKASEVFRYGFLLESTEENNRFKQLYSYYSYYVEIIYGENYEEIQSIEAISIDNALDTYVREDDYSDAIIDLFDTNI
ncbi:MAG: hypothetical protein HKO66_16480 [Saprospiraceae bacterium]|nr:hypothetical protein [Bacteroidia bacterium]NNE15098.1 hypothetical protein [Saprospiraceae bacterium]NNL93842.1 hypothetical protein [Saprospiraceae bacterium]